MDRLLCISSSPHIHSGRSTAAIMRDVIIALLPAAIAGTVIFGLRSLLVMAVCVGSCVGLEALYNVITKKEQTTGDLSAVLTGLLLGLNLSANVPYWQCVTGSAFAIVLVKCIFGGIGYNLVNPAITARVFMLVAFSSVAKPAFPTIVDTKSSATPLQEIANGGTPRLADVFFGTTGGAIGETCALALLIGLAYLLARGIITWHIPVSFVGSAFIIFFVMEDFDFVRALTMILSGSLLIGAIFMATDYVTSPSTPKGKIVFGVGAGVLTFLIRYYGSYPEGVSFAILLMNIANPHIEKLSARKVFGGKKI